MAGLLRNDPAPEIAFGRLLAVDFDVKAAFVEGGQLVWVELHRTAQRPAGSGRDSQAGDDGSTHTRQGTHAQIRAGWNGEQPLEGTAECKLAILQRRRNSAAS